MSQHQQWTNQNVVILGGTSGIGLALAKRLMTAGARVTVASRSVANIQAAQKVLGGAAAVRAIDVSKPAKVEGFFREMGPFKHLVTTAAVPTAGPFLEQPLEAFRELVENKFWGQIHAVRHGAPKIVSGGSITLFSGIVARKPLAGMSGFASVAGAIEALTRVLALELAPVRVNCISPGVVETPAWNFLPENARRQQLDVIGRSLPAGRIGTPEDVAEAAMMAMGNGFMTGTIVDVDGGHRVL